VQVGRYVLDVGSPAGTVVSAVPRRRQADPPPELVRELDREPEDRRSEPGIAARADAALDRAEDVTGKVEHGHSAKVETVKLSNTGSAPLTVRSDGIAGQDSGDFVIASNGCAKGTSVAPGRSCVVAIEFTPSAPGTRFAALSITDDATPSTQGAVLFGDGASSQSGAGTGSQNGAGTGSQSGAGTASTPG
jgi:hypothetical protein